MERKVKLAVQVIAARIVELCGRVQLQSHVQNGVWNHYSGGPADKLSKTALEAIGEAESLFCDNPLRLLDQAVVGSLTAHTTNERIGYALGCIHTLVSRTQIALQEDPVPAGQISLKEVLGGLPQPAPADRISLEEAAAMPNIGAVFAVFCLKVRETARREEIARRLLEVEHQSTSQREDLQRKLEDSAGRISRHEQRIQELGQQVQGAEENKRQLVALNETCDGLHSKLDAIGRTYKGTWVLLVLGLIIGVLGFASVRFQFERAEAGNYIGFAAAGLLLAALVTLMLLPERKR